MNTDIRIDINFRTNPKTKKLKRRGGLEMVDSLLALWIWTAVNRPCGNLFGMDTEDIELACDWEGESGLFVSTLLDLKWLDTTEQGCLVHDWQEHQPWAAQGEERSNKARMSRLARKDPALYEQLIKSGYTGVTREQYNRFTTVQRPYNETDTSRTTPAPTPTPYPPNSTQPGKERITSNDSIYLQADGVDSGEDTTVQRPYNDRTLVTENGEVIPF